MDAEEGTDRHEDHEFDLMTARIHEKLIIEGEDTSMANAMLGRLVDEARPSTLRREEHFLPGRAL